MGVSCQGPATCAITCAEPESCSEWQQLGFGPLNLYLTARDGGCWEKSLLQLKKPRGKLVYNSVEFLSGHFCPGFSMWNIFVLLREYKDVKWPLVVCCVRW